MGRYSPQLGGGGNCSAVSAPPINVVKTCIACPLHQRASSNCVPGRGAVYPNVKILLVGEAPGKEEDRQGRVFAGPSGDLMNTLLEECRIDPAVVRWTNTVRCCPKDSLGQPTKPDLPDIKTCVSQHLLIEIMESRPEVIVALGKVAATGLINNRSKLDDLRGVQHDFQFPEAFIEWAASTRGVCLWEPDYEKCGDVVPTVYNPKTCKSITYPVVVAYHPAASLHKKSAYLRGLTASDLVYARKVAFHEDRLDGVDYRYVYSVDELAQWGDYILSLYRSGQISYIGYDTETDGPDGDEDGGLRPLDPATEIVTIQVAYGFKKAICVPVSHPEGGFNNTIGIAAVRDFIVRVLGEIPVAGQNVGFDYLQTFAKFGFRIPVICFDSKLANQCVYSGTEPNDLDFIASKYLGMQGYGDGLKKDKSRLPKGKRTFKNLHLNKAYLDYACGDTDVVFQVKPILEKILVDEGLMWGYQHLYIETLIPGLEQEIAGLLVDREVVGWLDQELPRQMDELHKKITSYRLYPTHLLNAGCPPQFIQAVIDENAPPAIMKKYRFNMGSYPQKADLIFRTMGIPSRDEWKTEKGADSTSSDVLDEVLDFVASQPGDTTAEQAVIKAMQDYSGVSKLHTSYIANLNQNVPDRGQPRNPLFSPYWPKELLPWSVHPKLNLGGTATGRASASEPAIHGMPKKSAVKRMFKSRWREQGGLHLQFDQSQMEVRVLAMSCMSGDPGLQKAIRSGADFHYFVASLVFGKPIEDITKDERQMCKAVNFAVLYGAGAERVAAQTGLSKQQAQAFMDKYLGMFKGVAAFQARQHALVHKNGCCWTPLGRRRLLSAKQFSKGDVERRSVNTPIQSFASDITLKCGNDIAREITTRQWKSLQYLFVHDSLAWDTYPGEFFDLYELAHYYMSEVPAQKYAGLIDVPLASECEAGYSWGNLCKVTRVDRQNWKLVGKEENLSALVYQLSISGYQLQHIPGTVEDKEGNFSWDLIVNR